MHEDGKIIGSAVRAAQLLHSDDKAAGAAIFAETLRSPALRDALIRKAIRISLSEHVRVTRAIAWRPAEVAAVVIAKATSHSVNPGYMERLRRRMEVITPRIALMSFPLPTPGNKQLRNATRDEVIAGAVHYETSAGDARLKAIWLRLVARETQAGKTVGESLSETKLQQLRDNAPKQKAA